MDTENSNMSKPNLCLAGNERRDTGTLSEMFDTAFAMFNEINKSQEATNSPKVQSNVRRAMSMFEDATRLVSIVDMFSENEGFEEVATENIKYFLLPALLGSLTLKICATDDRVHIVDVAEVYFIDFLKRVKAYGLTDVEIPATKPDESSELALTKTPTNAEMLTKMVSTRNAKLQRYREQKELEGRLETLRQNLDNPNIDDETKREYFVTLVKTYITQALEELSSLAAERPILEHIKKVGHSDPMAAQNLHKSRTPAQKLQPIIITRDELQKKVYGAGYPSLPVLTVEEFYEKKIKDGDWPDPSKRNQVNGQSLQDIANSTDKTSPEDAEDIEKEERVERDDPELLAQARAMDEYKDTHRRGWGNRANRS